MARLMHLSRKMTCNFSLASLLLIAGASCLGCGKQPEQSQIDRLGKQNQIDCMPLSERLICPDEQSAACLTGPPVQVVGNFVLSDQSFDPLPPFGSSECANIFTYDISVADYSPTDVWLVFTENKWVCGKAGTSTTLSETGRRMRAESRFVRAAGNQTEPRRLRTFLGHGSILRTPRGLGSYWRRMTPSALRYHCMS
jgi:hypothetical protein